MSRLTANPLIQLLDEVSRLQGRFGSLFAAVHAESGLKRMEDLVLNAIVEADAPPTAAQIGRSLGHPRQVIQRAVNDLLEGGFLERLPNPDHKRAPLITLTARGLQLKERTDRMALAICDAFFQGSDPQHCESLVRELRQKRRELEAFARQQNQRSAP